MSRIRALDRRLALVVRSSGALWKPTELPSLSFDFWDQLLREDKARWGITYYESAGRLNKWASATAVGKRRIRFDPGYLERPIMNRAHGQTHEHRHCHEYPHHPFFRAKYVFDERFRLCIECQGVAAELWCMKAQKAREANMIDRVGRLIERLEQPWPGGYGCGGIVDLRKETMNILGEVIAA